MPGLNEVSPYAWKRRFNEEPLIEAQEARINLRMLFEMLPAIFRITQYTRKEAKRGRPPVLSFSGTKVSPDMGVPLGGLGGGTVTRGWRGDFCRWQFQPGMVRYTTVYADQFSLWAQRSGQPARACVLNPTTPEGSDLSAWNWNVPLERTTYHALFPRAWTVYEEPLPGLRLTCRQVSPVIPHNYRESSLPAGVFVWDIENLGQDEASVSLMFTFQNGTGQENDLAGGHSNHLFTQEHPEGEILGVELRHMHRQLRPPVEGTKFTGPVYDEDPLTFAIAVQSRPGLEVSYRTRFVTNTNGLDVWDDFVTDGHLGNTVSEKPSTSGLSIGAALAVQVHLLPGERRQVVYGLAWDMPVARFGWGTGWYRRYTRFYGREGKAAPSLVKDALLNYPAWEAKIEAWQQPVLENPRLPDWYKATLFNESYYLVDGGTIWTAGKAGDSDALDASLPEPEIGHFAYLESFEYRMYNTYDVHFYASFALAMLWPELELSLQHDFVQSLNVEHPEICTIWATGKKVPRKIRGVIPHDLGSPTADPWRQVNAYLFQDVSRWKDLNTKFVLQILRDYILTQNHAFLVQAWPAIKQAVQTLQQFDRDGDGLVENDGYPDQTYDAWTVKGPSAYTGGLWLACLSAAAVIADVLGEMDQAQAYRKQLERATEAYEGKLWNGEYYDYDNSQGKHSNSIMADQLAGQWYAKACGLADLLPPEHTRQALKKVFEFNVKQFNDGECGAVNGMRPNGQIDTSSLQSREMWAGTTFALAACMLQEGLVEEAFATAQGVYFAIYRDYGLWFQTPEAINDEDIYRAVGYMRPLSIWAMQWAIERSTG